MKQIYYKSVTQTLNYRKVHVSRYLPSVSLCRVQDKLNKSKRNWKPSTERMPYRCAELFCVKCDKSMGIQDIVTTNLETLMYCSECGDNHINYKYDKYLKPIVVTFGKSQCNSESIEVENE